MPFIGKLPDVGAFRLIDSITTSATDTYALQVEGLSYFPSSARNLIVSLNGVTQAPESAYTVSGSNIVFASALTASDVIDYILVIGESVDIGTPSDNTVGNAQLKSNLDFSGKTLTFSADQISGDAINGGTISSFASTGIDDNAASTAITIDSSQDVTFTSDAIFPDNGKAVFGAGSDLQIYHDGSASYIDEVGSGSVAIRTNGNGIYLQNGDSTETLAAFKTNNSADLYYDNAIKLATTSTGIDVTGNVTIDSAIYRTDTGAGGIRFATAGNIRPVNNAGTSTDLALDIGDPSFRFNDLHLGGDAFVDGAITSSGLTATLTSGYIRIQDLNSAVVSGTDMGGIEWRTGDSNVSGANRITASISAIGDGTFNAADKAPTALTFSTHGTSGVSPAERMRIDSSGRVGIGTSTPSNTLTVNKNTGSTPTVYINNSATFASEGQALKVQASGRGSGVADVSIFSVHNNSDEIFTVRNDGNVGIGTASPDGKLNVFSASAGSVSADADADELVLENSGNVGLSLLTASTGESGIYFGNPGTGGQKDFYLKFYHESHATTANRRAFTFNTASTERMRIDASGNVGIGTTSPNGQFEVADSVYPDEINITINNMANGSNGALRFFRGTQEKAAIRTISEGAYARKGLSFYTNNTGDYTTDAVERMRISASGKLLVGTTSQISNEMIGANQSTFGQFAFTGQSVTDCYRAQTTQTSGTSYFHYFVYNGSGVGSITSTGSGTSYNPSSDARLKENIRDYDNALSDVMKLKPRKYSWIVNGEEDNGFIAQELLEIPEFSNRVNPVTRDDDDPMYGVDYMKFVAVLTGAIQEQQAMIEELKAEVAALKGAN